MTCMNQNNLRIISESLSRFQLTLDFLCKIEISYRVAGVKFCQFVLPSPYNLLCSMFYSSSIMCHVMPGDFNVVPNFGLVIGLCLVSQALSSIISNAIGSNSSKVESAKTNTCQSFIERCTVELGCKICEIDSKLFGSYLT